MWKQSLCSRCQHCREIRSKRGSVFMMCGLAKSDKRFNKYPPQPVVRCVGFEAPAEEK